jgi:hypothetical protein
LLLLARRPGLRFFDCDVCRCQGIPHGPGQARQSNWRGTVSPWVWNAHGACRLIGAFSLGTVDGARAADPLVQPITRKTESDRPELSSESSNSAADGSDTESAWNDFFPPPDPEFDWIQLTSDEWLKGQIKVLYDFKLEFDSDNLGLLTFDWDDIKRVRTARPQAIRVEGLQGGGPPTTVFGVLTILDSTAYVGSGPEARRFSTDDIVSIATGTRREAGYWSGKVSLGASAQSGNSDLVYTSLSASVKRRRAVSRAVVDYLGNFSRSGGVETSNNHRLSGHFDRFKTTKWFWRPVFGEYSRDTFKNIEDQLTLDTGGGYHIIRTSKT